MVACPSCPIAPLGRGVTRGTCGSGTPGRGAVHPCPTNWSKAVYSCLGGVDFDPDKQTLRGESRDKKLLTDAEDGVRMPAGTGILLKEPNPTGSRPRDLIGLCRQHRKSHPPTHKERKGRQGNPNRWKGAAGKGGGPTGAPLLWHGNFI